MPHSSGGGSHGGGSHGGSHGGSGSSSRISKTYFAGASRYIFYNNGTLDEVYANVDPKQNAKTGRVLLSTVVGFIGVIYTIALLAGAFHNPSRMTTDYDTAIYISDGAHLMTVEEQGKLMTSLEKFQDETGITPCVMTVNNEAWEDRSSLEQHAYDLYVERFKDEKHWLIVYSQPKNPDASFNDWYWEGMQGNDTDGILTDSYTNRFNKSLQKKLLKESKYSVGEAIGEAFDELTPVIMVPYISWGMIIGAAILVVVSTAGIVLIQIFMRKSEKKYSNMIKVDASELLQQAKCDYCGGVYIVGHHTTCPHCQAQITPENVL